VAGSNVLPASLCNARGGVRSCTNEPREEKTIKAKLFVGNLSFATTQGELEALFGTIGAVRSVFLPTDRVTGRPRGFAFVEFDESSSAAEAIQKLDGHDLNGRNLRINEAQEKSRAPGSFSRSPGGFTGGEPPMGMPPRRMKSKGSRRNLRARKRSI
jgi:RNA recognition motif-containing protein